MVLAIRPDTLPRLMELARVYETEAAVIGQSDESGRLRVLHHDRVVCDLPVEFLHQAPRLSLSSRFAGRADGAQSLRTDENLGALLRRVLGDMNVCSREPVIREYDHEVQGNTILKPLAGHGGDCPQDGVVIEVPEAGMAVAVGVALLPAYGELDPCRMGRVSVDEAIRQLVVSGADPDRIGILDNFCMGNPMDPTELGRLVESARGMAEAAEAFGAPFISGKDSFYNYYETDEGPISIPVSLLISAIGIVPTLETVRGASLRRPGSRLALVGYTNDETGGSIAARLCGAPGSAVPDVDVPVALSCYRALHEAMKKGWVLSAHDLSEGGLAVAAAEAGFSLRAGIDLVLDAVPTAAPLSALTLLFSETGGRILLEIEPEHVEHVSTIFAELPFAWVGVTTSEHLRLRITHAQSPLIDEPLETLKATWKNALTPYY